ncbi:MAG: hypothetical protein JJU12_03245 [Chlamydiales bacterium]|nr:hypothetical protein [Chlamydiales bacterium]
MQKPSLPCSTLPLLTKDNLMTTIHLIGDSTIDNQYWVKSEETVQKQLDSKSNDKKTVFNRKTPVYNFAYAGFTTQDLLEGGEVGKGLPEEKKQKYLKARKPNGGTVKPIENLKKSLANKNYVLISVGKEDFRDILSLEGNSAKEKAKKVLMFSKHLSDTQKRYLEIINQVTSLSSDQQKVSPILMLQYRTDASNDVHDIYKFLGAVGVVAFVVNLACLALILSPLFQAMSGAFAFKISQLVSPIIGGLGLYLSHKVVPLSASRDIAYLKKPSMSVFDAFLERFYKPILDHARESKIPVLDLPNTFHPYHDLYVDVDGTVPNGNGAGLIADGIIHVIENDQGKGYIYSKTGGGGEYSGKPIPKSWSVDYPAS